jgi:hypothetical protein
MPENVIYTTIIGVVGTVLSVVAMIGYRHPKGYAKLYSVISSAIASIIWWCIVWDLSNWISRKSIENSMLEVGTIKIATDIIFELSFPFQTFIALLGLWVYCTVIRTLPWWLFDDEDANKQAKGQKQ